MNNPFLNVLINETKIEGGCTNHKHVIMQVSPESSDNFIQDIKPLMGSLEDEIVRES